MNGSQIQTISFNAVRSCLLHADWIKFSSSDFYYVQYLGDTLRLNAMRLFNKCRLALLEDRSLVSRA